MKVIGFIMEFFCLMEMSVMSMEVVSSGNIVFVLLVLTFVEILVNGEQYEGMYIMVENVFVINIDDFDEYE